MNRMKRILIVCVGLIFGLGGYSQIEITKAEPIKTIVEVKQVGNLLASLSITGQDHYIFSFLNYKYPDLRIYKSFIIAGKDDAKKFITLLNDIYKNDDDTDYNITVAGGDKLFIHRAKGDVFVDVTYPDGTDALFLCTKRIAKKLDIL